MKRDLILLVAGFSLLFVGVIGFLFHYYVRAWWNWPLVGPEWREARRREVEPDCDCGDLQYCEVCWPVGDPPWVQEARDEFDRRFVRQDWADQLHDINTALHEDMEEAAPGGHPIYAELSDDPDLIVWDAQQQAQRCWEIVHIEFPRLRTQLLAEYATAA